MAPYLSGFVWIPPSIFCAECVGGMVWEAWGMAVFAWSGRVSLGNVVERIYGSARFAMLGSASRFPTVPKTAVPKVPSRFPAGSQAVGI
jgi:hypothetical protein